MLQVKMYAHDITDVEKLKRRNDCFTLCYLCALFTGGLPDIIVTGVTAGVYGAFDEIH